MYGMGYGGYGAGRCCPTYTAPVACNKNGCEGAAIIAIAILILIALGVIFTF